MKNPLSRWENLIEGERPGPGGSLKNCKVMTLREAVKQYIKPGQKVMFGEKPAFPSGYPSALMNEVIRCCYGKDPRFTYISYGGYANTLAPMVAGKMIKKIITTFMGDPYPYPSPNPVLQKAFARGEVEVENWTMLTLTLRLMAGAAGLPFLPTSSLSGSSMAEDNPAFAEIRDPFEGKQVGAVKALQPDICLIHGWVADEDGNTVLNYPYGGNAYGALASREGVVVSVEKVVSRAEMDKKYRQYVCLPGSVVKAVVELPFGSHPSGHNYFPQADRDMGYAEDEEFILNARQACRDEESFWEWVKEWILDCSSHHEYLQKLGSDRLFRLRGKINPSGWKTEMLDTNLPSSEPASSPEEKMIVTAGRFLANKLENENIDFVLTGVGASHLASWLAYYKMLEKGKEVELMAETGLYGYAPRPGDPFLFANRNIPTGDLYSDIFCTLGLLVQGVAGSCLGVLGAGQIDRNGNINSTLIPETSTYLVGSGGGNDVASGAEEVVAVAKQHEGRFLEEVSYITSPGKNITTLISQYGVFQKDDSGSLRLKAYLEQPGLSERETLELIDSNCGWELQVFPKLEAVKPPETEELQLLRSFDPRRYFLGKLE